MAISEQEQSESLGKRVCEWWKSMPNHRFKIDMPNDHAVTYSFFTKRTIVVFKPYSSDYYSPFEMKTRYLHAFHSFLACLLISPKSKWVIRNRSELDSLLSCSFDELEVKLDLKGF